MDHESPEKPALDGVLDDMDAAFGKEAFRATSLVYLKGNFPASYDFDSLERDLIGRYGPGQVLAVLPQETQTSLTPAFPLFSLQTSEPLPQLNTEMGGSNDLKIMALTRYPDLIEVTSRDLEVYPEEVQGAFSLMDSEDYSDVYQVVKLELRPKHHLYNESRKFFKINKKGKEVALTYLLDGDQGYLIMVLGSWIDRLLSFDTQSNYWGIFNLKP
ncbi:MAG TPA: hypothetical protein ENN60_01645 [archaeon]|nr:hypothetical protein [archaeon]